MDNHDRKAYWFLGIRMHLNPSGAPGKIYPAKYAVNHEEVLAGQDLEVTT